MKKLAFTFLLCLLFIFQIFAQSPYQLTPKKELVIVGAGVGIGTAAFFAHKKLTPLSLMEIEAFQEKGISSFEKWATMQGSEKSDNASDILLVSTQIIPGILTLADKSMRKDVFKIAGLYSEVLFLNTALTALAKNTVRRSRPLVYNPDWPLIEQMSKGARASFYSGHTSEAAAMSFLTARLYADYHPDSKWKPVVWTAAAVVPAATGFLRMRAGKHFPSDVAVGYIMGAAIGYFLPKIHLRKDINEKKKDSYGIWGK